MDDTTVFRKTRKGVQEVETRAHGLERHFRRLLIVVDGIKCVAELSAFVRATDVQTTIQHLITHGYIETRDANERPPGTVAYAPAANDPAVFALVKRNAMVEIRRRLGPVSTLLVTEIDTCNNAIELRAKLRNIENVLIHVLGAADGTELARKIGGELTRLAPPKQSG